MSGVEDAEGLRTGWEALVVEAIAAGHQHHVVDGTDFGFLDQPLHVVDGVIYDPYGRPIDEIAVERERARRQGLAVNLAALPAVQAARADVQRGSQYLIDGDEFGYPGQQLHVVDGDVLQPTSGSAICTIDEHGLRRFYFDREAPRRDPRWVGVGREIVVHYFTKRTRFPVASILDITYVSARPTGLRGIVLGGTWHGWYRFTLSSPATVRYFGLLSLQQRRLHLTIPWEDSFIYVLGGRWRDLLAPWSGIVGSLLHPDERSEIYALVRQQRLTPREAAIKWGLPEQLYDEAAAFTFDPELELRDRRYWDLRAKFDAWRAPHTRPH
jgi:hypothetical protein